MLVNINSIYTVFTVGHDTTENLSVAQRYSKYWSLQWIHLPPAELNYRMETVFKEEGSSPSSFRLEDDFFSLSAEWKRGRAPLCNETGTFGL